MMVEKIFWLGAQMLITWIWTEIFRIWTELHIGKGLKKLEPLFIQ